MLVFISKNYFDNYHEAWATSKKLKKSQTQNNVTVFSAYLFDAEQHVIFSSKLNETLRLLILLVSVVNYY